MAFALTAAPANASVGSVSAGQQHTCAVKTGGAVVCWGDDSRHQTEADAVGSLSDIEAGGFHTCGLGTGDAPVCWGDDSEGQSTIPAGTGNVSQITAGVAHTCVIKAGGVPDCWGLNTDGQAAIPPGLGTVTQIRAGDFHTCAIKTGGTPECWGWNDHSQTTIPGDLGTVSQISPGFMHTCAIKTTDDTVACWGEDSDDQSEVPATVGPVEQVSAGGFHTCAIKKADHTPVCWGASIVPDGIGTVTRISAGFMHTCAVKTSGTVVCWGDDSFDQLGRAPAITSAPLSTQIAAAPFTHAVTVTDGTFPSALAATGLPQGLQLTGGAIGGTPTQTGTFAGTITASDGVFAPATQSFSIAADVDAPVTTDNVPAGPVNHPVTVTLAVTDAGWGDVAQTLYSVDGSAPALVYDPAHKPTLANGQVIKYSSVDTAGNAEAVRTSAPAKLDTTAPTVTITAPVNGATYVQGRRALAAFACSDACTGTAASGAAFDTAKLGRRTFTVTARDAAGNLTTRTVSYTVAAPPATPDTIGPAVTIPAKNKTLKQRKGAVRFTLGKAIEPTTGTIALNGKSLKAGSASFTAAAGKAAVVKIKLSKKAKKALAKAKKLKVTATVTVLDAAGNPTVKTFKLTIKLR